MIASGNLKKMSANINGDNLVEYNLQLGNNNIFLNNLVGHEIEINYSGIINCISCGAITKKSYAQGFCFSCMQTSPEADDCVLRPLMCKAHLGIARDMEWAKEHCLQPHYVYLANTGEVKVGVTRESQIPTRWIDQGASAAIIICRTPNRHIAGLIESFLSDFFSDKTVWKKMVSNNINNNIDLNQLREKALKLLPEELTTYKYEKEDIQTINYPVIKYPTHPQSLNLDDVNFIRGSLSGIKGQYLIFDDNRVINIRRHTGYYVEMKM